MVTGHPPRDHWSVAERLLLSCKTLKTFVVPRVAMQRVNLSLHVMVDGGDSNLFGIIEVISCIMPVLLVEKQEANFSRCYLGLD